MFLARFIYFLYLRNNFEILFKNVKSPSRYSVTSYVLRSDHSFFSNHGCGPPILSYLDPLAALVITFGRLQQWAAKWEWLALNLSSSIHYHDNWQTMLRIIQIHADPLNLNKVERQSGSGSTEQFSRLGFVPVEQEQAVRLTQHTLP